MTAQAPPYGAGHKLFKWSDARRERPVWADVWYPADRDVPEAPVTYSLGSGLIAESAPLAASNARFPVVLLSPGAGGSAANYSWLTEPFARRGIVVVGLSHFGESWLYGAETVNPAVIARLWMRPPDCTFALTQLAGEEGFSTLIDTSRVAVVGHSSGGATAIELAGGLFNPLAMVAYCASSSATEDRGCDFGRHASGTLMRLPPEAGASFLDDRVVGVAMMDPAGGPGHDEVSLARVLVPALVIGAEQNDFLPFEHHAGRYARLLPNSRLLRLDAGEGHFVFVNACQSELAVNGVPLCLDRATVDRTAVHDRLWPEILGFVRLALAAPSRGVV